MRMLATFKKFALLSVCLTSICSAAWAKDISTLKILGFSKDGKYLAFEQYGTQDGSGFGFSQIAFIDVDNNSYAADPVGFVDEDTDENWDWRGTEQRARQKAAEMAVATLAKLQILPANEGETKAMRLHTDVGARGAKSLDFLEYPLTEYRSWRLTLIETDAQEMPETCIDYRAPQLLQVDLTSVASPDSTEDSTVTLQKDRRLPQSRGCAFDYEILQIVIYHPDTNGESVQEEAKIAAFLYYKKPGFEGADHRIMAVTGRLPKISE